jgi:hypothetical protein
MPDFSSENDLRDSGFSKIIPNISIYDTEFVGVTDDFVQFCREGIRKFLKYLSNNNLPNNYKDRDWKFIVQLHTKQKFSQLERFNMMSVFDGLNCEIGVDFTKETSPTWSFTFSEKITNTRYFNYTIPWIRTNIEME